MINNKKRTDVRVDLEIVEATSKGLAQIQQRLNLWITTGELLKYKHTILPNNLILFEICRVKKEGE